MFLLCEVLANGITPSRRKRYDDDSQKTLVSWLSYQGIDAGDIRGPGSPLARAQDALVSSPQSPGGSYRDDAYWHPLHEGYDAWCKAEQEAAREVATRTLQAHVRRTKARIDFSRHRNAALWLQRVHRGQTSRSSGLPLPSDTQLARLEMRFGDAAQPKERIRFLNAVVPCLGCFI